jgi:acyl-coenzyme A synthetase/AMP-(fatty) acid ligase
VLHGGVVNFLRSMAHTPGLKAGERLLAVTTLSFDIAVLELLLPLTVGASIVLAQRTDAIDGQALKHLIESQAVNVMQATPSTWHLLLEAGFQAPKGFRALCGGEALSPALATRLLAADVAELWNMYGPTETTVWSTLARITDAADISVGRPIDATVVRLLDEANRECGVGEPGEICIGGAGVAQGYHARPELTAERFIADPFDATPGARLYRTGDLGAWNADGTIRHMGRLDHQVKLRGYRIELGEIEAAIEELPSIARAALRVESFGPMDDRLVAYVVASPGAAAPTLTPMRRALGHRLPDYMLPQVLRVLEAMPLLPNGKIDRKALGGEPAPAVVPAAIAVAPAPTAVAPTPPSVSDEVREPTATIALLQGIWNELLGTTDIGANDNFFERGGHSMLALNMVSRVELACGKRLPLLRVGDSTLAALAAMLDEDTAAAATPATPDAPGKLGNWLRKLVKSADA